MDAVIIIPAIKKNVAFTDDLVKKLDGKSLIQRAVDKAGKLVNKEDIYVVTDSEEISLICKRNSVNVSYKKNLRFKPQNIVENLHFLFSELSENYKEFILLSPYAPLLQEETVEKALKEFRSLSKPQTLIPVKREISRIFKKDKRDFKGFIMNDLENELLIESQAFKIISSYAIQTGIKEEKVTPLTFEVSPDLIEIRSYQDWWVCEKLLKRKKLLIFFVLHQR